MTAYYLLLILGFFAITVALVYVFEKLRGQS